MVQVESAVRLTRIVHAVFLLSIIFMAVAAEKAAPLDAKDVRMLQGVLALACISDLGFALWFRRRIPRAVEALRAKPEDPAPLEQWRTANLVTFAVCEAIALFGVVLRFLGGSFGDSAPFYAVAILMMLVWTPRLDLERPPGAQ